MSSTDLKDLGIFAENIVELQIKEVEVPTRIKIPNWPEAVSDIKIRLGKRDCLYPIPTNETGMLRLVRKRRRLTFFLRQNGTFGFWVGPAAIFDPDYISYISTDTGYPSLHRIQVLVLFHQFKQEIFLKIIQKLKADLGNHNQVIAMVEKAIEPFVPFLVADQLSN